MFNWRRSFNQATRNYELYILLLPTLLYFIVFHYWPMYGVQIAFKNFMPFKGVGGSPWVGFDHFDRFLSAWQFWDLFNNTVLLSLYSLMFGFPIPIILSVLLNQIKNETFKKFVQTVTYAPNFISIMVVVGMLFIFLSPSYGLVNQILDALGYKPIFFMGKADWFRDIYVWSGIWQTTGISMIIYLAALSSVDPSLHEAAVVDGASKLKRMYHIDIPGIMPTISIVLILSVGNLMSVGFEKVFLMQNDLNLDASEIIATYVYKVGMLKSEYSYSTAIGFFNSAVNCLLLIIVNFISKRMGKASLW